MCMRLPVRATAEFRFLLGFELYFMFKLRTQYLTSKGASMKKTLLFTLLTLTLATANAANLVQPAGETKALVTADAILNSYTGFIYNAVAITPDGSGVGLMDGSVWEVRSWDSNQVLCWLSTDGIIIIPDTIEFSSYDYVLLNQVTGVGVEANMLQPSALGTDYTFQVTGYDDSYIYLTDGSVWGYSSNEFNPFGSWTIGDIILIGANPFWDSDIRPNVLINGTQQNLISVINIQ